MVIPVYNQAVHSLAASLRTKISGETDEHEALDVIRTKVGEQVHAVSVDDIRDGLLKYADNLVANPVSRANPAATVEAAEKTSLLNELTAVVQGTKWAAMSSGDTPTWERKR